MTEHAAQELAQAQAFEDALRFRFLLSNDLAAKSLVWMTYGSTPAQIRAAIDAARAIVPSSPVRSGGTG